MLLAQLLASFQSLSQLPTSKLSPSSVDSQVGGFVYVLGPCGSLQWTLLWDLEFILLPQPPQVFTARCFEALFPYTGILGCMVCLTPQLFLPVYPHWMWDHLVYQPWSHPPRLEATTLLCVHPAPATHLCPSYQSRWMFLLQLVGCWTSIQFDFLAVLVVFVFKLVVIFLLVVWGGTVCLLMPPSWLKCRNGFQMLIPM